MFNLFSAPAAMNMAEDIKLGLYAQNDAGKLTAAEVFAENMLLVERTERRPMGKKHIDPPLPDWAVATVPKNSVPAPTPAPTRKVYSTLDTDADVVSGIVIHKVEPTYPKLAKLVRVQGTVTMKGSIDAHGVPQGLHVVHPDNFSPEPRYALGSDGAGGARCDEPVALSTGDDQREPTPFETLVTVSFTLGQ